MDQHSQVEPWRRLTDATADGAVNYYKVGSNCSWSLAIGVSIDDYVERNFEPT